MKPPQLSLEARIEQSRKNTADLRMRLQAAADDMKGERIKVRLPYEILYRTKCCAEAFGINFSEFVNSSCRSVRAGKIPRVPSCVLTQKGTREGSETVWVRVPRGYDVTARNLRETLLSACAFYEPHIQKLADVFRPEEGVDYLIGGKNYTKIIEGGKIV